MLTKPIGTGVVATAHKRGAAPSDVLAAAVASMTTLNAAAAEAALAAGVRAATDVTGFSLLGHLHRMLRASGASAEVVAGAVPLLPGALSLTRAGFVSGGTRNNIAYLAPWASFASGVPDDVAILLQDAQTSGGLLLASSAPDSLLSELAAPDVPAAVIGPSPSAPSIRARATCNDQPGLRDCSAVAPIHFRANREHLAGNPVGHGPATACGIVGCNE